ncbi:MAG TPA: cytochrome c [Polyangiaceae bacterium]|nr:cytochrome c [Polyangiaceae bacterium]
MISPFFRASLISLASLMSLVACSEESSPEERETPDVQRSGDALRGRDLLVNNGTPEAPYLNCGIPAKIWDLTKGIFANVPKLEGRNADNAELPYFMSAATTPSGVKVVTTNCLFCHAASLGGSVILGLGDANRSFAGEGLLGISGDVLSRLAPTLTEEEKRELDRFISRLDAIAPFTRTDTVGMNPADQLFGGLAAHRDRVTLEWSETADPKALANEILGIFTDVPPYWNMYRRDRMFYSGFGRGDHARIMMSSSLLCMNDASEAVAIDAYFPDIEAYILSLRAPSYESVSGKTIDSARASRGRSIYTETCQRCHGARHGEGAALRAFVPIAEIGTDPAYAESTARGSTRNSAVEYYYDFFNASWMGTYGAKGRLAPNDEPGYSPPPLDGIWATAPYFHNGSVPTLQAVLDPPQRPRIFRRSTSPDSYAFESPGWPFEEVAEKADDVSVYDTTRVGNGNTGHTFAAHLNSDERLDLIEYLKTF